MAAQTVELLVSLCKRRGFIFPGSAFYGTYDHGPLGVELKSGRRNARRARRDRRHEKRYGSQNEIGTPFCVAVDFDTLGDGKDAALQNTVPVRHRDSMAQERVAISGLETYRREKRQ